MKNTDTDQTSQLTRLEDAIKLMQQTIDDLQTRVEELEGKAQGYELSADYD